jgi:hypothetical protein
MHGSFHGARSGGDGVSRDDFSGRLSDGGIGIPTKQVNTAPRARDGDVNVTDVGVAYCCCVARLAIRRRRWATPSFIRSEAAELECARELLELNGDESKPTRSSAVRSDGLMGSFGSSQQLTCLEDVTLTRLVVSAPILSYTLELGLSVMRTPNCIICVV